MFVIIILNNVNTVFHLNEILVQIIVLVNNDQISVLINTLYIFVQNITLDETLNENNQVKVNLQDKVDYINDLHMNLIEKVSEVFDLNFDMKKIEMVIVESEIIIFYI